MCDLSELMLSIYLNFCSVGEKSLSNGSQMGHGARWGGVSIEVHWYANMAGKMGQEIICLTFDWIYGSIKSFNNCSLTYDVSEKIVHRSVSRVYALT